MINCELFEKISTAWHDGNLSPELEKQVQDHVNICEHCQAMDIGDAWVKDQLGSLDQVEPSPDFEIRLQERIDSLSSSRTGRRRWDNSRRFPRSVAFGAGLATAVAVGVALLLPQMYNSTETQQTASTGVKPEIFVNAGSVHNALIDTSTLVDSTALPEMLFDPDQHSRVVSTGK